MSRSDEEILYKVFLFDVDSHLSFSAAMLTPVETDGISLDITVCVMVTTISSSAMRSSTRISGQLPQFPFSFHLQRPLEWRGVPP